MKDEIIKLLGVSKEDMGPNGGWSSGYSLSEYEITKSNYLKFCKRITKTEPEVLNSLWGAFEKKAREILGL